MSLINEALKRAEEEKLAKSPSTGDADLLPSAPRRRRLALSRALTLRLLLAGLLLSAGFAAYRVWATRSANVPSKAAAADPMPPAAPQVAAASPAAENAGTHQAVTEATAAARSRALTERPVPPAAAESPTTRPSTEQPEPEESDPSEAQLAAAESAAGPTTRPTTQPNATAISKAAKATTQPAAPKAEPETKVTTRPPPPSDFKVNGIVLGPEGPTAIVNGRPVRAGEKIGRATVVKITAYAVTLDISGHRFNVGM